MAPRRRLLALPLLLALSSPPGSPGGGGGRGRLATASATAVAGSSPAPQWFLVPEDDLAAFEAVEYALLRINEMRRQCNGFHLAPLQPHHYRAAEVYVRDNGLYSSYRLHIEPVHKLAPANIHVRIARQHSVTDLSLFQVTGVEPVPCDLYSTLDDAELLVPWKSSTADRAQSAAIELLNAERKVLCPQRPQLQFIRTLAASAQPAAGTVVRMELEMREASTSFQNSPFTDVVSVVYTLDNDVPGECTVSPAIYPARSPCEMRYVQEEESADGVAGNASVKSERLRRLLTGKLVGMSRSPSMTTAPAVLPESFRRLSELRRTATASARPGRRLMASADAAPPSSALLLNFKDEGLDIPDNFDPRLKRTLCFPRGFSRSQGSCGASWAFAATAVASFRECLHHLSAGQLNSELRFFSAQELVSCNEGEGCSGGSADVAFYYMKHRGIAREACSPYRMRCFNDNSAISVSAADSATSTPKSSHFESSSASCPLSPDPLRSPCKCLPSVFHPSKPVGCLLLPNSCPRVHIPHYFKIAGTAQGNTVPQIERHMMQELISRGPLYVSMLVFEDFYDPVSWTESGIYIHKRGHLIGKHAATAVGWGTDSDSRDYWLLLNSFGDGWQQEGYFKIDRGESSLNVMKFGAWGVDWARPEEDRSKPTIVDIEVAFSPVLVPVAAAASSDSLRKVWLQVSAFTDEHARLLVRVQGLSNGVTGEAKDVDFKKDHVLRVDLLKIGLLGDRAKVQLWAADRAQNTATWGPYTLEIPDKKTFHESPGRRLVAGNGAVGRAAMEPAAEELWV